eukprot:632282-Pyramimonas_sp.AAC.1
MARPSIGWMSNRIGGRCCHDIEICALVFLAPLRVRVRALLSNYLARIGCAVHSPMPNGGRSRRPTPWGPFAVPSGSGSPNSLGFKLEVSSYLAR